MARLQTQWWELPTVYSLNFTNAELVAGATINRTIPIQADSAFKWNKATFYAAIDGAPYATGAEPIPQVSIQIQDTGSSRLMFDAPVPVSNFFGTGRLPFILPVAYVFRPRSALQITVTNFSTATAYMLRLAFIGNKIYEGAPEDALNGYVAGRYSPLSLAGQVQQQVAQQAG